MKEKLIMFALGAAWTAGIGTFGFIMTIKYTQIVMQKEVEYLTKDMINFVEKDVYEVDKMLLIERLK